MEGIDYSYGSGLTAQQIKDAGKAFVCRYLSGGSNSKDITKTEFDNLIHGGLKVCLVWETTANRMMSGRSGGEYDAKLGNDQANKLGASGIPIYFACDWDASESEQSTINSYLDGAASIIGRGRTGMYGGYYPVHRAFNAGKMTYGWQTYAWSGGQWDGRAQLQQYHNGAHLHSAEVDLDRSMKEDYGQWTRPGTKPGAPPSKPADPAVPPLHVDYFDQHHNHTHNDVRTWQDKMRHRGWPIHVDQIYGPESESCCRSFQAEKHLTVDGKVGPQTWKATFTSPVT